MNLELDQALEELGEIQQQAKQEYESKLESWWNSLTQQEREDAFYAVIKRVYQADVEDRGSYRHALYDVFGFDMSMYGQGMQCGYMDIHNMIHDGADFGKLKQVNRVEVIDHSKGGQGRELVKHLLNGERIDFSLQDDDRTLKIFIEDGKSQPFSVDWPPSEVAGP